MPTTSDPAPGSDMASAPTASPATSFGRYVFFCAGVPFLRIWLTHRLECAPYERPTDAEAREISSMATMWARYPIGVPPNSSSTVTPRTPSAPSFFHRSGGNWLERSISAARGAISAAANARTELRSRSTSSPRAKRSPEASPAAGKFGVRSMDALRVGGLLNVYVNVNLAQNQWFSAAARRAR